MIELDVQIAEKIMGENLIKSAFHEEVYFSDKNHYLLHYSEIIGSAMLVVKKLAEDCFTFGLHFDGLTTWEAYFCIGGHRFYKSAKTPAEAICLAALATLPG